MTKEKILSKQTITNFSGVEFVKPHNALMAMQEYADQEMQRLKDGIPKRVAKRNLRIYRLRIKKQ